DLAKANADLEQTTTELDLITSSSAWAFLSLLWSIRLRLAPRGSHRERGLRLFKRVVAVWRNGGAGSVLRRAREHVKSNTGSIVWSASSHGLSDGTDVPPAYDVVVLPILDWDYRFQRPQ